MTPCRVADTRSGQGFTGPFGPPSLSAGASRTFPIQASATCTIPSIAQAYSFNVTVVPSTPSGFVTADPMVRLQLVPFDWRAAEYPGYHFGTSRGYGLIAQQVEQVFPELVSPDKNGFKAVNYSELPLLLLEAIRELDAKNQALQSRIETLEAAQDR
jgi:hypothetical protein